MCRIWTHLRVPPRNFGRICVFFREILTKAPGTGKNALGRGRDPNLPDDDCSRPPAALHFAFTLPFRPRRARPERAQSAPRARPEHAPSTPRVLSRNSQVRKNLSSLESFFILRKTDQVLGACSGRALGVLWACSGRALGALSGGVCRPSSTVRRRISSGAKIRKGKVNAK